ncbi:MAG: hypothetical protein ACI8TE_000734 [Francisella sp.]|jgi:hypothetical protein
MTAKYTSVDCFIKNITSLNSSGLYTLGAVTLLASVPGVIIHQILVSIKNRKHIYPKLFKNGKYLSDYPKHWKKLAFKKNKNTLDIEYLREKITSHNTFYYVRVYCMIMGPLFAFCITTIVSKSILSIPRYILCAVYVL